MWYSLKKHFLYVCLHGNKTWNVQALVSTDKENSQTKGQHWQFLWTSMNTHMNRRNVNNIQWTVTLKTICKKELDPKALKYESWGAVERKGRPFKYVNTLSTNNRNMCRVSHVLFTDRRSGWQGISVELRRPLCLGECRACRHKFSGQRQNKSSQKMRELTYGRKSRIIHILPQGGSKTHAVVTGSVPV